MLLMIIMYNRISKKKLRVENAFSQIKIQCKKRADLVPYLADVVKGSADHNMSVSANAGGTDTLQGLLNTENQTDRALKNLISEGNKNPNIKANVNFLQLQTELVNLEKAISVSRGFYNDAVMMYNRTIRTFPANIYAKIFRFKKEEFFDPSDTPNMSVVQGKKCPSCGAVATSSVCSHCGARIPLM